MKIVLVLLVVAVALWALLGRQARRGARPGERDKAQAPGTPGAPGAAPQEMIGCAHCGVLFPAGEACRQDGRSYCSPDHLKAGPSGS